MKTVSILDYIRPEDGDNRTLAVVRALRENAGDDLRFELGAGEWHFYAADAFTEECFESNNDGGEKQVLFSLHNRKNITVDGKGAVWTLHGRLSPFVIDGCENVTVEGITSDVRRPFYTQGKIVRSAPNEAELAIDTAEYPYTVEGTNWYPYGDCWKQDLRDEVSLIHVFGADTHAPIAGSPTAFIWVGDGNPRVENLPADLWRADASQTPEGNLLLKGDFGGYTLPVGDWLVVTHENRLNSFCFIKDSQGVTLRDVVIYQMGSMGVIGQNSADILLHRVRVMPNAARNRVISTNADATHFVNCYGTLTMRDCVFDGMMDDATNIHGIYTVIENAEGNTLTLRLKHFQQRGVIPYRVGDRLRLLERDGLNEYATVTIRSVELADDYTLRITTNESIPAECVGGVAEDPDNHPEVLLEGNRTGNNRPRGFLINTSKKAVVRGNTFYNSCCGVFSGGDPWYWYEAGPMTDLTVTGNTFMGCNVLDGGFAVCVSPDPMPQLKGCYHGKVTVADNRFVNSNGNAVFARSVADLTVTGNTCDVDALVSTEACAATDIQTEWN
ncbi:MAG: hypothetical protein E7534_00130 [Ruminococcaceae bacterium]|nr:hypothetical protein [Oscillospiraceae bacterium]